MLNKKILINFCSILFFLVSANASFAEIKTFEKEYTYQASEEDSRNSSRTVSLREVKRLLLEQLGTYLENITEVQNFHLTKDQIVTLTAGIVSTEVMEETWDGKVYWLKAKISADPESVIKSIDKLRQDRQKVKELDDTQKRAEALLRENERLKEELKTAKGTTIEKKQEEYTKGINKLNAIEWLEKGNVLYQSGNYREAVLAYTNAIKLDNKYANVYYNRGVVYYGLGNYPQAIKDFDKAIELNPKDAKAYTNRGVTYEALGNYPQAIKNFDKAIELNPKEARSYYGRGFIYGMLGNYQQSIKDYDRAIELDPKLALAYFDRGVTYGMLGNSQQQIKDFKIAAQLGNEEAQDLLRKQEITW